MDSIDSERKPLLVDSEKEKPNSSHQIELNENEEKRSRFWTFLGLRRNRIHRFSTRQREIPHLIIVSEGKVSEKTTHLKLQGKCQAAACEEKSQLLEVMAAQLQNAREIGRAAVLAEREEGKKALKEEQRRGNETLKQETEKVKWEREQGKKTLKEEQRRAKVELKREKEKTEWMRKGWEKSVEGWKNDRELWLQKTEDRARAVERSVETWNKKYRIWWMGREHDLEREKENAQRKIRKWKGIAQAQRESEKADKRLVREGIPIGNVIWTITDINSDLVAPHSHPSLPQEQIYRPGSSKLSISYHETSMTSTERISGENEPS